MNANVLYEARSMSATLSYSQAATGGAGVTTDVGAHNRDIGLVLSRQFGRNLTANAYGSYMRTNGLQQAGVTIMAGTDAGFLNSFNYPGVGLHEELALYVDKGLTAAQALAAATRAGPAWFGRLDQYGSITAGRRADLLLLDANPLDDIRATRSIRAVILRGRIYDRPALDRLLEETRTQVAAWNALPVP